LNMAMHGMRDISLITTPPAKRLAIKTFWHEKNPSLIREAILREVLRGGQVYYLHNDVATIDKTCEELKKLIPEAKIDFAHGQMHERRLEQIMADFYHQRFNVLVCTTIIETGIDIPTANTIILERADQLGLAQMHQLRGRVGRSHHQAYCYLLSPPEKSLPADSVKRLEAIVSLENLGAGFSLAMHDMEIRGAGELLGEDQSGNMHSIGFSLYMEMLEQAVEDIKAGKIPDFEKHQQQQCDMDLKICAIIPDDYIPDVHQRLVFYKRISHADNEKDLHALQIELIDRFGLLPEPVKNLVASMRLKLRCIDVGITKLHLSPTLGVLEFNAQPKVDGFKIIQLIQQQPQIFKLHQQQRLQFKLIENQTAIEKLHFVGELIEQLSATPP
jgi:transcription-repair coupling factor (superfamily II helicase)